MAPDWIQHLRAAFLFMVFVPQPATAIDPVLVFPLPHKNPDLAAITAVLDNNLPVVGIVQSYAGDIGDTDRSPSGPCYRWSADLGFQFDKNIPNYIGNGPDGGTARLCKDGHRGYDYRTKDQDLIGNPCPNWSICNLSGNTPVLAAADGEVICVSLDPIQGANIFRQEHEWNCLSPEYGEIRIDHGNGYKSVYLHLAVAYVHADASLGNPNVKAGDVIGISGHTGPGIASNAAHLHFGVHLSQSPVDPYAEGLWRSDTDIDQVPDPSDNCPFNQNFFQVNSDTLTAGDACQCGDVDTSGTLSILDVVLMTRFQNALSTPPFLFDLSRCSVVGGLADCDNADTTNIRNYLAANPATIGSVCADYFNPRLTNLSPVTATVGDGRTSWTLGGANFHPTAWIYSGTADPPSQLNAPTTVTDTILTVGQPSQFSGTGVDPFGLVGAYSLQVFNPIPSFGDGQRSNTVPFTIYNPEPSIDFISGTCKAGFNCTLGSGFDVRAHGSGFVANTAVIEGIFVQGTEWSVNGTVIPSPCPCNPRPSGTEAQLSINHQLILTPGTYTVEVCNWYTQRDPFNPVCGSAPLTVVP